MKNRTGSMLMTMIAGLALVAGCESQSTKSETTFHHSGNTEMFLQENDPRIARTVADHQAVLGAQADPTLYACHFDGTNLNGLGKMKLDAMLADGATSSVYIDTGKSNADGHRAAVNSYLAAAQRADGSIAVETGAAPASLAPVAPAISRMSKTESPGKSAASNQSGATNSGGEGSALFSD